MAKYLVSLTRREYMDVIVSAEDSEEAIQKAWEGQGEEQGSSGSDWEYDGNVEELDELYIL